MATLRRRVEEVIDLLEPCLKEGKGVHSMHYETMWGWKTKEGLRASIQAILEKDTDPSEETYEINRGITITRCTDCGTALNYEPDAVIDNKPYCYHCSQKYL